MQERIQTFNEKKGLHTLNTAEKIVLATLSVQQAPMKVESKQTKLLSLSTQDFSLKSQLKSARHLAMLACPNYDE